MCRIVFVLGFACLISAWYVTAQFTQKRSNRGPSHAMLKEECCQLCGDMLKIVPDYLRKIGDMQELAVSVIQGYWQGDKLSLCCSASSQKLNGCNGRLRELKQKMEHLLTEFDLCIAELRAENGTH